MMSLNPSYAQWFLFICCGYNHVDFCRIYTLPYNVLSNSKPPAVHLLPVRIRIYYVANPMSLERFHGNSLFGRN